MPLGITVVDYGMGNLRSVARAVEHASQGRARVEVSDQAQAIRQADGIVLPGQGAMRDCMAELNARRLIDPIRECLGRKPMLGICMGLQVLFEFSEEDPDTPGFGHLKGDSVRLDPGSDESGSPERKIPHIGWNRVRQTRIGASDAADAADAAVHPLWRGIADEERFYFAHSYRVRPKDPALVAGCCDYGGEFTAAVAAERLFAVQFHPEKSQRAGLALLTNFIDWAGQT
ncbi:MAG: imidazole glycerol phosphate synthase subunit HisH [Ectothiorhodospiraceae bacterium AqS1]|nr:imidazole glycerol phosphate synthase subunit HisH [Ectothiorhodospiraceae bacterium AqS1]MBF2759640.1 imidazole glycerol phosphate synthase subunit HisH [Ectothiorhodospiraceae bacterium AqS1]